VKGKEGERGKGKDGCRFPVAGVEIKGKGERGKEKKVKERSSKVKGQR